jgi:hypothetical protein
LAKSEKLEKRNIFIELVPPNITGILQPLEFAVNKNFQEAFGFTYDRYIAEAIKNPYMETKQGNPKVPNYETVSNLHAPLREILDHFEKYKNSFQPDYYFATISESEWFWPQKVSTSCNIRVHSQSEVRCI